MSRTVEKKQSDIVTDVRTCYDEIAANDGAWENGGEGSQDESELDTIIKSKIAEAFDFVYGNCSKELFNGEDYQLYTASNVTPEADGTYYINLTRDVDDYLRMVWVKSSSWMYALDERSMEGDADIAWALDPYCGATYEKPVIIETLKSAVVDDAEQVCRMLRIVKPQSGDDVTLAYIPKAAEIGETSTYTLNGQLYGAVVYYICGLVATTFGEKTRAQEFFELAVSMMGANRGNTANDSGEQN